MVTLAPGAPRRAELRELRAFADSRPDTAIAHLLSGDLLNWFEDAEDTDLFGQFAALRSQRAEVQSLLQNTEAHVQTLKEERDVLRLEHDRALISSDDLTRLRAMLGGIEQLARDALWERRAISTDAVRHILETGTSAEEEPCPPWRGWRRRLLGARGGITQVRA